MELSLTSKRTTLKTAQKYCATDITLDVAVQDKSVTPGSAPQAVTADTGYAGLGTVTVAAISTESGAATPSAAAQTVTPSEGKYFDTFTVAATPLDPALKITAGTSDVAVTPSAGKIGLTSVTVHPTPSSAKTATPTKASQVISPDAGKLLSSVTVNPIPDQYIIPSGTKNITTNGTTDVTAFASVNVNVPAPDLSGATATAATMLSGYTAYTGAGLITGTITTYAGEIRDE